MVARGQTPGWWVIRSECEAESRQVHVCEMSRPCGCHGRTVPGLRDGKRTSDLSRARRKRSEVRRHFADLGATGEEEIYIHAASAPQEAVQELCQATKEKRPVLIVIDPLFKFVRIRDEKAYAEVCNAIEPLLTLARESGAHVLLSHHSGKMERADATDSILGSTAIFGGVDTAIILKKADRYRTVQSCQRYGTDWPELVLNFDPAERSLSLGVERSEAEAGRIGEAIATYLAGCDEPQTRVQIEAHVEGKTKHKRTALRALCAVGRVSESGAGAKGDPLRYALNPSTNSQAGNEPKPFVDSCSHVYAGTREQQSENGADTPHKNWRYSCSRCFV